MPEATFTADALVASYFRANAVVFGAQAPSLAYYVNDTFSRNTGGSSATLGGGYRHDPDNGFSSPIGSVDGSVMRISANAYDAYLIGDTPISLPPTGTLEFDVRNPTSPSDNGLDVEIALDNLEGGGEYVGIYGSAGNLVVYTWNGQASFTAERNAMYRVRLTWTPTTTAVYAWKVGDEPGSPLVSGARWGGVEITAGDNYLLVWSAPATENFQFDNLRIYTDGPIPAQGVLGVELVRDTFTRTTTPPEIIGSDDLGNPWTLIPGPSWPGTDYLEYVDGSELVLPPSAEIQYGIGPRFSTGSMRLDCYLEATGDSYIDLRVGGGSGDYGGYVTVWNSQLDANGDTYIYDVPFTTGWYTVEVYADGSTASFGAPGRRFRMRNRDTGVQVFDLDADYSTLFDPYGVVLYIGNYSTTKTIRIDNVGAWRTSPTVAYSDTFTAGAVLIKTMTGKAAAEFPSTSLWTVENSSTSNSSNATVSLSRGSVIPGDLMVAVIARRISTTSAVTFTAPTAGGVGWDLAYSGVSTDPTSTYSRIALAIWIRTTTDEKRTDTGTVVTSHSFGATVTSGGTNLIGFMEGFRGSGGPWYLYDAATVTQIVNTAGDTAQVIATLRANSLAVVAAAADVSSALTTIPSPFSQRDRAATSLSAGYGTYANPTDGIVNPTVTWNVATGVARSAVLLSITGRAPGFTADAILEPGEGGVGSFTSDAVVQLATRLGSITAGASLLRVQAFPPALTRVATPGYDAASRNSRSVYVTGYPSAVGSVRLMFVAARSTSVDPVDSISGSTYGGVTWTKVSTVLDPISHTRVWVLISTPVTTVASSTNVATYGGSDTPAEMFQFLNIFSVANSLTTPIEALMSSLVEDDEAPLGTLTLPMVNLPSEGIFEAYGVAIRTANGATSMSTPSGLATDNYGTTDPVNWVTIRSWRAVTPLPGPKGPYTSTITSPDSPVMSRIGVSVSVKAVGGISVSAELLDGVRLYASLTANAVLKSQLAATQQHPRDDHFHVGATPADMVLTSVAIGPWPIGSVLQEVLEWLWGQYGYHSSVNQRWAAFTASAVRFGTQSRALSAAASFIQFGTHVFPANAVVRSTQGGATFANAWIYSQSVDIVEGFLFADAEFVFPPIVWADAIITRALEADFTASALALRSSGASLAADAFVQPYFRADATLVGLDGLFLYLDAVLLGSQSSSISTDAVLHMTGTSSFTADSARRKPQESSLAADSLFTQTAAGSLAGDAVLLVTTSAATQVDASITTSAVQSLTVDATILAPATLSVTADAAILRTQAGALTADATLSSASVQNLTADATITVSMASSLTGDAVIVAEGSTTTFDDTVFDSTYFE